METMLAGSTVSLRIRVACAALQVGLAFFWALQSMVQLTAGAKVISGIFPWAPLSLLCLTSVLLPSVATGVVLTSDQLLIVMSIEALRRALAYGYFGGPLFVAIVLLVTRTTARVQQPRRSTPWGLAVAAIAMGFEIAQPLMTASERVEMFVAGAIAWASLFFSALKMRASSPDAGER
jgi:hypothetical protein